jgi:hypothetical protein
MAGGHDAHVDYEPDRGMIDEDGQRVAGLDGVRVYHAQPSHAVLAVGLRHGMVGLGRAAAERLA